MQYEDKYYMAVFEWSTVQGGSGYFWQVSNYKRNLFYAGLETTPTKACKQCMRILHWAYKQEEQLNESKSSEGTSQIVPLADPTGYWTHDTQSVYFTPGASSSMSY
jgi:uncharacterized GH25 family protein